MTLRNKIAKLLGLNLEAAIEKIDRLEQQLQKQAKLLDEMTALQQHFGNVLYGGEFASHIDYKELARVACSLYGDSLAASLLNRAEFDYSAIAKRLSPDSIADSLTESEGFCSNVAQQLADNEHISYETLAAHLDCGDLARSLTTQSAFMTELADELSQYDSIVDEEELAKRVDEDALCRGVVDRLNYETLGSHVDGYSVARELNYQELALALIRKAAEQQQ